MCSSQMPANKQFEQLLAGPLEDLACPAADGPAEAHLHSARLLRLLLDRIHQVCSKHPLQMLQEHQARLRIVCGPSTLDLSFPTRRPWIALESLQEGGNGVDACAQQNLHWDWCDGDLCCLSRSSMRQDKSPRRSTFRSSQSCSA